MSSHLFWEESQVIRDERKDHGAVDESSSEQQIRESTDYTLIVRKNWSPRPSATRSYGRLAGWLWDKLRIKFNIFKILYRLKYTIFLLCLTRLSIIIADALKLVFSIKACCKACLEVQKTEPTPFFPGQSLLLKYYNVLNDSEVGWSHSLCYEFQNDLRFLAT